MKSKSARAATKKQQPHRSNMNPRQGPVEPKYPQFNYPQNNTHFSTAIPPAAAATYRSPEYYSYKDIVSEQSKSPTPNYSSQSSVNAMPRRILFSRADSQASVPTSPPSVGNYSYVSSRFRKEN
jgi:hypothetical protein